MKNALFSGLVECADGSQGGGAGFSGAAFFQREARLFDESPCPPDDIAVAQAALSILLDAFDCRLGISQCVPPKLLDPSDKKT